MNTGEEESLEFLGQQMVTSMIKDWVTLGAKIAHAGRGDLNERELGFHDGVKNMQWLQLAEPWLIAKKITDALQLAGWTAPEGHMMVTYKKQATK